MNSRANPLLFQKKIWFINTFKPVVPLYETIFSELEKRGYHSLALISRGRYNNRNSENISDNFKQNCKFIWVPSWLQDNKRWCNLFYYFITPFKLLFESSDFHVYLTQPPLFFILGTAISRFRKIPYIIHIMDMYPDFFVGLGVLKEQGLIYQFLLRLANHSLKYANHINVIGTCMKDKLVKTGIHPDSITITYNWSSEGVSPINSDANLFLKQYDLQDKFIVMYSGNMGFAHEFRTVIKSAHDLIDYHDLIFVFIGRGARRCEIEEAIARGGSNIKLLNYQPKTLLSQSLSAASIHFISLRNGFEGVLVPSKFYSALASGHPIIYEGNSKGEIARAIQIAGCGRVIDLGDADNLVKTILFYYNNRQLAIADGNRSFEAHQNLYHQDIGKKVYIDTLIKVIKTPQI